MTVNYLLGKDAKLYIDPDFDSDSDSTPTDETTLSDEISNAMDVTANFEAAETDISTRANQGWAGTAPTLKSASIDFDMLWKPGDTAFDAIRIAFLAAKTVAVGAFDQAKTTAGAQGPVGTWAVTKFSKSEPLKEAQKVSITLKLSAYGDWFVK